MRPGQPSSRGEASSRPASVPAFYLYGESLQPPDERLIHIETIAARSRLHAWIIRPHRHRDLHQVLLIERGRVEARLDARTALLRAPAAILVPPGAVHSFRFQPETVGVVVSFASTLASELRAASPGLSQQLERCAAIALDRAALRQTDLRVLAGMLLREFGRSAPGRRLAMRGALAALLANLQRLLPDASGTVATISARDRELVARFREQVEQRFRQHPAAQRVCRSAANFRESAAPRLSRRGRAVSRRPRASSVAPRGRAAASLHLHVSDPSRVLPRLRGPCIFQPLLHAPDGDVPPRVPRERRADPSGAAAATMTVGHAPHRGKRFPPLLAPT